MNSPMALARAGGILLQSPLAVGIRAFSRSAASLEELAAAPLASSSGATAAAGWILRGIKEHPKAEKKRSSWWTRKGPDGQPKAIPMWEKIYWGFGAAGLSLLIVPRIRQYFRKDDAEERAKKALDEKNLLAKRSLMIPNMVSGKSFLDEADAKLYEGLSPREINAIAVSKFGSTGVKEDPFEGLSPEEIDAMFAATE